ncbi:threonine synthase [Candidatus Poribacteria bacterium]|nr:threonine synthase [Candidatus Poribacteria bacterium]MEE2910733.1 threonine synthase [Candidatus Poribacteria bacterium]|tara:strand:- start:590 stop:1915 length:1326 start_codon:yes stop_codon:yes gene_type:complete
MQLTAHFQCASGCDESYPLNRVIYRCEQCNGLLEVKHDVQQLKKKDAQSWIDLFDRRYMRTNFPYGSGVWGKKELVCPNVDDENVVSMFEGGTNLFWAERFGRQIGLDDLWIKQCGNSHTGSFKDLGMTVLVSMVKQMLFEGKPIKAVICASTGDTSAALSAYAAAAGIPSVILLPRDKVSTTQLIQPIANGALTLALKTDFDGCMSIIQRLAKTEGFYLANSMNSLRIEGQKTISFELVQQFDWNVPDWVIIPGGNLGNVTALGLGFLMMKDLGLINKLPRIVCAQSARANPLYRSFKTNFEEFDSLKAETTLASAIQIGNPVSVWKAIKVLKKFDGIVEQATESELTEAVAQADQTGLFNCPHTGVALAALMKLAQSGQIQRRDRVIVISTASGLKFPDFKIGYHERSLEGVESQYANSPVELDPDYDDIRRTIDQLIN